MRKSVRKDWYSVKAAAAATAAGAERLKGTPRDDAGVTTPEGRAAEDPLHPHVGHGPPRGHGEGPRGWGAAESDSEAPPKGVSLD